MDRVKVVHMTSVHTALDGRIFHKECRTLARAGFDVTSIGPHFEDTTLDQVRIRSVRRDEPRLARMTRTVWRIYREAVRQDADIYHFHDPELIPAGLALRAAGKDVIYDLHEDYPKEILGKTYLPEWSRGAVSWLMKKMEAGVCRHFSALVAVTPAIADRFRTINGRTVIVYNYPCSDELVVEEPPDSWEVRRQSVAYAGGITGQRGIYDMVAAMSLLPASLAATLELAGPTVQGEVQIEDLHGLPGWERVRYHGRLDLPNTFRMLHTVRAGLVVLHPLPNYVESMPQKLFEYMGAGIPVVASDFPLWRRIVGDCRCGIFVKPHDVPAIAHAIEYILTHPAEAAEMGRRGQSAVLERYNWDLQAKKLVDLYRQLGKRACVA